MAIYCVLAAMLLRPIFDKTAGHSIAALQAKGVFQRRVWRGADAPFQVEVVNAGQGLNLPEKERWISSFRVIASLCGTLTAP